MAQSLMEYFSARRCVLYSRRHIRLTKQLPGAHVLGDTFENEVKSIGQLILALDCAEEERAYAYDLTVFKDVALDNVIRDAANACKKFDRDNLGANTFAQIFPENTSSIITTHHLKEPSEVRKVIARIATLGIDHPLKKNADDLLASVTDSEEAIKNYYEAVQKVAKCQVDLNMAKFNLIRTYNNRILDATKIFGRKNVNKLFPQIGGLSDDETDDESSDEKELSESTSLK